MTTAKQQALEEVLGQPIDLVDWQQRMKEGVLVTLTIKRWRARKKLALSELGISPPTNEARSAYEELLSLGSKILLPQQTLRELDAIERGARINLGDYAFSTPFGTFVPYTSYAQWKEGNDSFKERFFAKRDEIVSQYSELVAQLLSEYDEIARHTYALLCNQTHQDITETFPSEASFVMHFRQEIIQRNIKTAEDFAASFIYEESLSRIPLLTSLEGQQQEVITSEEVSATATALSAEREVAESRGRMLAEMNRDLVQKAREQKEGLIESFLTSLATQVRAHTYDAVTSVLASIKSQETLQGRSVIAIKHLIEQLRNLNFYGDQDIDGILTTLHGIIEKPAKERNIGEISRQLRSIATLTRGTILALGETPREDKEVSVTDLGITAYPSDDEIREAREELTTTITLTPDAQEEREEREDSVVISLPREEVTEASRTE